MKPHVLRRYMSVWRWCCVATRVALVVVALVAPTTTSALIGVTNGSAASIITTRAAISWLEKSARTAVVTSAAVATTTFLSGFDTTITSGFVGLPPQVVVLAGPPSAWAVQPKNEALCGTGFFTNIWEYRCTSIGDIGDVGRPGELTETEQSAADALLSKFGSGDDLDLHRQRRQVPSERSGEGETPPAQRKDVESSPRK